MRQAQNSAVFRWAVMEVCLVFLLTGNVQAQVADQPSTDAVTQGQIDKLIEQLGDWDSTVRKSAVNSLVSFGSPAVPPLVDALCDGRIRVRRAAASALGEIGSLWLRG